MKRTTVRKGCRRERERPMRVGSRDWRGRVRKIERILLQGKYDRSEGGCL
jgi:hypothetical protein